MSATEAWTLASVAAITCATIDSQFGARPFSRICTDSRGLAPGEYFLALRGEKFDGHEYARAAAVAGAAGIIVDRQFSFGDAPDDLPVIRVDDTLRAYGDLAAARRREWAASDAGKKVLAIGGSAGKTTTRRLVASALGRRRRVLEPRRNFNNLVGVPCTLLELEPAHEAAVLELGMNQPGELRRLAEIAAPTAALLTQIGLAHIGMFKSIQDLIHAKLDLFRGCAPGTPLAVNAACPRTVMALDEFTEGRRIVLFTDESPPRTNARPDVRIENAHAIAPVGYRFDLIAGERRMEGLELKLFGRHHLANVAAATALLLAADEDPALVAEALPDFQTEPLRGERVEANGYSLILDCYNASPPAMLGALESLGETPGGARRVIVLADMQELGEQSALAHQMLLVPLRALAPALFFGLGPRCAELARQLAEDGWQAEGFTDRAALTEALAAAIEPGDQILFKGSHSYALEKSRGGDRAGTRVSV